MVADHAPPIAANAVADAGLVAEVGKNRRNVAEIAFDVGQDVLRSVFAGRPTEQFGRLFAVDVVEFLVLAKRTRPHAGLQRLRAGV